MAKKEIIKKTEIELSPSQADLFHDVCIIIDQAQQLAYRTVNETLIKRNWLLGLRIQHEVLKDQRAEYGEQVIKNLAKELTTQYGSGYSRNNLPLPEDRPSSSHHLLYSTDLHLPARSSRSRHPA